MKRLLSSTTALSLAFFNVQPWPLMAQTLNADGSVVASDGSILCQPTDGNACNPEDYVAAAQAIDEAAAAAAEAEAAAAAQAQADAEAQAAAEAQAQAEAEAQAAAEAQAQAEAEAQAAADAAAQAEAEAKAQADAEAQAAADAAAQAEADAQAEAEAQAQAEAEAQAAIEAQAAAEAEAQAAADAAAEAEAAAAAATDAATEAATTDEAVEEPATDEAATDEAVTEEPAADEAVTEEPATDEATAEEPATDEAVTDEAATEEPATDEAATEEPATDEAVTDEAATDEAATEEPATDEAATDEAATDEAATDEAVTEPATDEATTDEAATDEAATDAASTDATATTEPTAEVPTLTVPDADAPVEDAAAGMKVAEPDPAVEVTPVEAPKVTEAEVESLTEILAQPDGIDPAAIGAAATLAAAAGAGGVAATDGAAPTKGELLKLADQAASKDATVTLETLTKEFTRSSSDEFARAPVAVKDGKKSGLSDLEKVGLFALGALVVGAVINEGRKDERKVVSNTGDRIVVLKPDGTYQVYKDDDAVLRRPGSTVRTETFRDGSTRSIVERADGSQIVTIRDASGRVLRRAQYDSLGRELVLIDDLEPEEVVVVSKLPKPRKDRVTISTKDENAALKAALAAKEAAKAGRKFSLRQIREIPEVRALAATIDVESVTFDSASAAIKAAEAKNLADLGGLMQDLLDANPGEMFLIEGHTDAVGKAALNLALSDRRAESVALALTEYFDIPPENMVVQGYGESELLIDTQKDERANRRVLVRVVTPLLKRSEQN